MTGFFKGNRKFILRFLFLVLIFAVICAVPLAAAPRVSNQRQKLIDYGLTLQGIRYRYGGKKPETGFDCSGFVAYVARESLGINISASAAQMYEKIEHIEESDREPGDLIFFCVGSRITHVGIYLGLYSGEGKLNGERIFLHAASDGSRTGVIVSSINERYWKNHFKGYGRILPATELPSSDDSEKIMEYSDETKRE